MNNPEVTEETKQLFIELMKQNPIISSCLEVRLAALELHDVISIITAMAVDNAYESLPENEGKHLTEDEKKSIATLMLNIIFEKSNAFMSSLDISQGSTLIDLINNVNYAFSAFSQALQDHYLTDNNVEEEKETGMAD